MAKLRFKNVCKIYDNNVTAVNDFNLEIEDKEFIVFVGPSGCGKSTILRMVAGLEKISSGELYIDDVLVNDIQPKDRNIAMVFQSYALYPHMTVYENMAYGLKMKKVPKDQIDVRVKEVAQKLGLIDLLSRKPKALSGGQCQRVALGRAIVRKPKVFLMDEPLSNLDAKLRVQMREEITRIHNEVGATTIYVTHDQTEAMTMASRIVILRGGIAQQIGTPKEVFNYPNNIFVASFIGSPAMNFIKGIYRNGVFVINEELKIKVDYERKQKLSDYENKELIFGVRPDDIICNKKNDVDDIGITCEVVELLGREQIVYSTLNNQKIVIKTSSSININMNDKIYIKFDLEKSHFFDSETTNRIK